MHGQGTCQHASGAVYGGQWNAGRPEGRGAYRSAEGDLYEGDYFAGQREGYGTCQSIDGDVYDGEWKAGMSEGRGIEHYADGSAYDGEWLADQWDGRGVFVWADGLADSAIFAKGEYVGEGVRWSAEYTQAWMLQDGEVQHELTLDDARLFSDELAPPSLEFEFDVHRVDGTLGMHVETAPGDDPSAPTNGIIEGIVPGGGADAAGGLRVGDRILAVDGMPMDPGKTIADLLTPGKQQYRLRVERSPLSADELYEEQAALCAHPLLTPNTVCLHLLLTSSVFTTPSVHALCSHVHPSAYGRRRSWRRSKRRARRRRGATACLRPSRARRRAACQLARRWRARCAGTARTTLATWRRCPHSARGEAARKALSRCRMRQPAPAFPAHLTRTCFGSSDRLPACAFPLGTPRPPSGL